MGKAQTAVALVWCDHGCVLYSGNILLSQLRPSTARHRTHTFAFYWKLAAVQKSEATATWTRDKHIFNSEETTGQSILWRTLYIFPFLFMIIMSSVLIHSWVFLSDKSQIVNMPSLRKNINTVCTYGFSVSANWWRFVCYKFQQQQSSKTISTLWKQGKYENIDFVTCFTYYCGVWCEPHTVHHCTEEPATTPATGEGLAWGDAAQNMVPSYTTF